MAYKVLETRRMTPYQCQYFWHRARQRRARTSAGSAGSSGVHVPRAIVWIAAVCLAVAMLVCLVMLALLAWVAVSITVIIVGG
jgi:Flp pilus assembly protein TadB